MSVDLGVRLLTLRCDALAEASTTTITDLVDYFEADLIYIIEEKLDMRIVSTVERTASCSVVYTRSSAVHTETVDGVTVSIVSSLDFIGGASTASGREIPEDVNYVICDEIQTSADSVTLDVSLDGLDHLARFQNRTDREVTFLTGPMEASYDFVWKADVDDESVRLPIRGLAPTRRQGGHELACISLDSGGRIAVSTTPADKFGLQSLSGVGKGTAPKLARNGYETRDDVAAATEQELREVQGIGESKAQSIRQSAHALSGDASSVSRTKLSRQQSIVRCSSISRPTALIRVSSGSSASMTLKQTSTSTSSIQNRREKTQAKPPESLLRGSQQKYDRTSLIAWNGHNFDFKHLSRFIRGHAPEYADYWSNSVFEYDLFDWAVRKRQRHPSPVGRTGLKMSLRLSGMGATRLLPPWMGNHWRRPSNGFSCPERARDQTGRPLGHTVRQTSVSWLQSTNRLLRRRPATSVPAFLLMKTPRRPDSWTSNNARRPRYRPQPDRPYDQSEGQQQQR